MRRHTTVRRCLLAVLALALAAGAAQAADEVKGTLTVQGKPIALTHVWAFARKGFFDPKKQDVVALFCDADLPAAAVRDRMERDKAIQGAKVHCVEQVIDAGKQVINYSVEDSRFHPPESGGSTYHVFEAKTFDGKTIAGRSRTTAEQKTFSDIPYTYDITFSAAIAPMK
jgi:hypothetical protein